MKYTAKSRIKFDGVTYEEGDTIELTEEQAALVHVVKKKSGAKPKGGAKGEGGDPPPES